MTDFITGLRSDLVGAAERERRRGALARAAAHAPRRTAPARRALAGALALAVAAVAIAIGVLAAPQERSGSTRVLTSIRLGGMPLDAAAGGGAVWVADYTGRILRVDPASRRVVARIDVAAQPQVVAAEGDAVWVRAADRDAGLSRLLLRVAPAGNRVAERRASDAGAAMAIGDGALWLVHRASTPVAEGLDRVDLVTGRRTARIPLRNAHAVAAAGGVVWGLTHEGAVVQIDARSGRVLKRWPRLAPLPDATSDSWHTLLADARGAWILSTARAQLTRIEGQRIVRRLPIPAHSLNMVARTPDGFWIAIEGGLHGPNVLERLDPTTGAVTRRIPIGAQRPMALVAVGSTLVVVTGTGRALIVGR